MTIKNFLFIFLLLSHINCYAENEEELNHLELAAPLMPLTETIPIEMDGANRQGILNNKAINSQEIPRNQKLFSNKSFPWIGMAFAFLAGAIFVLLKTKPLKEISLEESKASIKAKATSKALGAIDRLSQEQMQQPDTFIIRLSNIVRSFAEERYQLRASTYTTQEFLAHVAKHPALEKKSQEKLKGFLNSSDQVKFALHEPSIEECKQAESEAKAFIQS